MLAIVLSWQRSTIVTWDKLRVVSPIGNSTHIWGLHELCAKTRGGSTYKTFARLPGRI